MSITDTWRARLQELIDEAGGVKPLADKLAQRTPRGERQWTANYLTQLRSEKKPFGKDVSSKLERRAGKRAGWMNEARNPSGPAITVSTRETPAGYIRLPQYEAVSAGGGAMLDGEQEVVRDLDVADWWVKQNLPRDIAGVRVLGVLGDSMSPEINHGDVLFVDIRKQHFDAPGIYVINWNGRALVKRLEPEFSTGRLAIKSRNAAYTTEFVDAGSIDQLHIGGKVVAWWTLKKF